MEITITDCVFAGFNIDTGELVIDLHDHCDNIIIRHGGYAYDFKVVRNRIDFSKAVAARLEDIAPPGETGEVL